MKGLRNLTKNVVNIFTQYDQSYGDNLGDNDSDAQNEDDNKGWSDI